MRYTGMGEQQRVAAGSTTYQYDATGLSSQNDGTTTTTFTSLPDGTLISEKVGSSTYYYLGDGAGSVAGLVDSTGALKNTYTYDPLGNATTTGSIYNPFTFQGGTYDSQSDFYYTGSGYYDPANGQSFGCKDKGKVDPGEDLCGEDEDPACGGVCSNGPGNNAGSGAFNTYAEGGFCFGGWAGGGSCGNKGCCADTGGFGFGGWANAANRQLKKLSNGEIRRLKRNGINPEQLKRDYGCNPPSRCDLYKDQPQWVYVARKNDLDTAQETHINLRQLPLP